ncbi:LacI family transcriptional regulator [Bifidobacterium primatium]|uniref:LacI family transcriptional regulator n=1 Tax=Bifidobacterium primatium TaxID=2045438 RepID=A0A2M9HB87_9BIFI|nr:LacI family transcriptional regulator [Bifidobacterium primatium]
MHDVAQRHGGSGRIDKRGSAVASLTQVAKKAGVSPSTVSRYVKGHLSIKAETATKIQQAAQSLGYDLSAQVPESDTIALIVPELTNPFYSALSAALAASAQAEGRILEVMVSGRQASHELRLVEHVVNSGRFDGLIYAGMHRTNRALNHLASIPTKLVLLDEDVTIPALSHPNTVTVDNFAGAYQATSYLISLGHRRIAHISGPAMLSTASERLRGYRAALENAGIPFDSSLLYSGPYTEEYGASVFPYLLQHDDRPTAVFAGSDIVAIGVLSVCRQYGIRIPEDLSIIGCDGIDIGKWLRPSLTTLVQPVEDMADCAIGLLTQGEAGVGSSMSKGANVKLPLSLTIRESVAAPRA